MAVTAFSPLKFKRELKNGGNNAAIKGIDNQNSNFNRRNVNRQLEEYENPQSVYLE